METGRSREALLILLLDISEEVIAHVAAHYEETGKLFGCRIVWLRVWEEMLPYVESPNMTIATTQAQLQMLRSDEPLIFERLTGQGISFLLVLFEEDNFAISVGEGLALLQKERLQFVVIKDENLGTRLPVTQKPHPVQKLSVREKQVLGLLAEGRSNKEIAKELSITRLTVKSHVAHICRKFGVSDRAGVVYLGCRFGYLA